MKSVFEIFKNAVPKHSKVTLLEICYIKIKKVGNSFVFQQCSKLTGKSAETDLGKRIGTSRAGVVVPLHDE